MRPQSTVIGTAVGAARGVAASWFGAAGPLAPIVAPAVALLLVTSLSRLGLYLAHLDRLGNLPRSAGLFWVGFRIDASLCAYLTFVPLMSLLLLSKPAVNRLRYLLVAYWTFVLAFVVFLELSSVQFIEEFDFRPNRLYFEYLEHPKEVLGTLWAEYSVALIVALVVTGLALATAATLLDRAMLSYRPWRARRRVAAALPALVLLFLAARGTLSHRPLNISMASFSENHLANELALNSSYSLLYAIYSLRHESDPEFFYGRMPKDEILSIVSRSAQIDPLPAAAGGNPLMHHQPTQHPRERPLNLVIVLEESLGAEYVGSLGGLPLTPNLDRLSKQGLFLRRLYSTGTRTVRAIEAVVSGYPPTPGASVVKLDRAQHGFFTLGSLLQTHGYRTEFIYGGESHFDNMGSFLSNNGFDRIHDEPTFPDSGFHGTWGVSDEDLFLQADRLFREHGETPFFALILTTSNHVPFEFPAGRIELYESPANTRLNAMKYADHALGGFFERARESSYYDHTVFLVVADHNTKTKGNDLVPIHKFRIPGLILAPGLPPSEYTNVASQLDLGPTLLDLMGLDVDHPMIGRSLVGEARRRPDRAIMQFGNKNAYMEGERVVVLSPRSEARQFTYTESQLVPAERDRELVRVARAHALLPGLLYRERLYGPSHP